MPVSTMYVCEQGAIINKSGGRIRVTRGGEVLAEIPVRTLKHLLVFGNVQLTTQATAALLEHGVDVSFLSVNGRLRGRLTGGFSKNIYVRMAQHARWMDKSYRVSVARCIVRGKIVNMLEMIRYYRRLRPDFEVSKAKEMMVRGMRLLDSKSDVSEIMGIEGSLTAAYFYFFGRMLKEKHDFKGRRKHLAPDSANALLSLGYTLVTNELSGLLESLSLDPYLGFLHGIKYGRRALALDVVEEFRQPLVDRFTLRLLNQKIIQDKDFTARKDGGLYLKDDVLKKYLSFYEDYLRRKDSDGQTWRNIFIKQVNRLGKALLTGSDYSTYKGADVDEPLGG